MASNTTVADQQDKATSVFSYHPPPGGDVSLKSSDGTIFVSHSPFLALASPVFSGMFSSTASIQDVVELSEDAESVSLMLRFIYPPAFLGDISLPLLRKSLYMGQKYQIDGISTTIDYVISRSFIGNPLATAIEAFELALKYHLKEAQKASATRISSPRNAQDVLSMAKALPDHSGVIGFLGARSVRMHTSIKIIASSLLHLEVGPPLAPTENSIRYETMMCRACANRTMTPPWMGCWSVMALELIANRFWIDCVRLFHISIMYELEEKYGVCQGCAHVTRGANSDFKIWAEKIGKDLREARTDQSLLVL